MSSDILNGLREREKNLESFKKGNALLLSNSQKFSTEALALYTMTHSAIKQIKDKLPEGMQLPEPSKLANPYS